MNLLLVQSLVIVVMLLLSIVVTNNLWVSFASGSQFSLCGQIISPTTTSPGNGNGTTYALVFDYKKSGGITGLYSPNNLKVSYNSDTKKIIVNGQELRQLQLQEEIKLRRTIIDNGLFNAKNCYLPTPGSADYQTYVLNFTLDDEKPKLIIWTDASPSVPKGIWNISSAIEALTSK